MKVTVKRKAVLKITDNISLCRVSGTYIFLSKEPYFTLHFSDWRTKSEKLISHGEMMKWLFYCASKVESSNESVEVIRYAISKYHEWN